MVGSLEEFYKASPKEFCQRVNYYESSARGFRVLGLGWRVSGLRV